MTWRYELTLPYPISANRYWVSRVLKHNGRTIPITYVSTDAKEYKASLAWAARAAGVTPITGAVEVGLELWPALPQDFQKRAKADPLWWDLSVRCMDLDNSFKVLLDALKGIAWSDDAMIRKSAGEIMVPDHGGARVVLRIRPYERAHPQLPLPLPPAPVTAAAREGVPF